MAAGRTPDSMSSADWNRHDADPFFQRSAAPGPVGIDRGDVFMSAQLFGSAPVASAAAGAASPQATPEGGARSLTASETAMARSLFGGAVDYSRVKVHNGEYLPFGLQPDDTAMTPNGELYFNPKRFVEDFSLSSFLDSLWFMHEMVHVWQYQLGYPVKLRGAIRIGLGYAYTLSADKLLSDYNMEAQGNVLSDYWALSQFTHPPSLWESKHRQDLPLYRQVLRDFIADPANKNNLPN